MSVAPRLSLLALCMCLILSSIAARAAGPARAAAQGGAPAAPPPTAARAHGSPPGTGKPAAHTEARASSAAPAEPAADQSEASPGLETGSITATIVDEHGLPMANIRVRLGVLFQRIAEGESRSERFAQTDQTGSTRFTGLTPGSDHAYRVTVQRGPASYTSPPFNLRQDMGQSVLLHVYPSTSNVDAAMIGMRGYFYIETRDDVFQFEVLFRVFNVGLVTWVPQDVVVSLPTGFKAFKAQESMTDVRFEAVDGVGARLKGTFPPGQSEVSFRFQLPKTSEDSAVFHVSLPPNVAEMRVIAEASATMNLDVEGFDHPVPTANQNGQRVLVAVKVLRRRDQQIKDFVATLSGIPVPGPGRWAALLIAVGFGVGGVFAARGAFDDAGAGDRVVADKKQARELLLRELMAVETARRAGRIGPRSYEQARTQLIDAIARLKLPERERAPRKSSTPAGRKRSKSASARG